MRQEEVIRCYKKATKLDTKNWKQDRIDGLFLIMYPEYAEISTSQRLSQQKRMIVRNKKMIPNCK